MIERIGSKREIRSAIAEARREGKTIGLVPTMGALHEGHLSLVRAARARTDFVVASVFVNPTQFAPGEDFERYPRQLDADLALLGAEGAEIAFVPSVDTMYSDGTDVTVNPGALAQRWEGALRPGHFSGVATVVAKILNIVRPDLAFFGEKDYQQLKIVERMALELDLGVGIVGCPIIRDGQGLALSSRNAYLSPEQRAAALALPEALEAAAAAVAWGETKGESIEAAMRSLVESFPVAGLELDYAAVVDPHTLEPAASVNGPVRALISGRVGATHLIDNCLLVPTKGGSA